MRVAARILAVAAASSALALGSLGVASAAPARSSGSSGSSFNFKGHQFACAKAPSVLATIAKAQAEEPQAVSMLKSWQQQAKSAGLSQLASGMQKVIDRVPTIDAKASQLAQSIRASCPGATPKA